MTVDASELADAIAADFDTRWRGFGEARIEQEVRRYDVPRLTSQLRVRLAERGISALFLSVAQLTAGGSLVLVTGERVIP